MTEYFDVKQIADKMRVSVSTVWRMIRNGQLDTFMVGTKRGKRVATQEQIDRCIQGDNTVPMETDKEVT